MKARAQNHALIMTQMAKIDTLFMTKTGEKRYPFGGVYHMAIFKF